MKYIEIRFNVKADDVALVTDVLAALLVEAGYDSFVPDATGMSAYIPEDKYSEPALLETIGHLPVEAEIEWSCNHYADQNWNEEWEKHYFKPIVIGNECVIHSTFHTNVPEARYKIVIDPKMAFGTGHHETTTLMLQAILAADFTGRSVLDMGCGTAVLAILAGMKGASPVVAVDIDEFATENAVENVRLNRLPEIEVRLGGVEVLQQETFDFVFANINRNILLADMHAYVDRMKTGSHLFMSGFYVEDIPAIQAEAERLGLRFAGHAEKNRWARVECVKD